MYPLTMVAANSSVAYFGPWISPINSFFFIGLDLTLRDWLQLHLSRWMMVGLIVFAGLVSYLLNPATEMIAIASVTAFSASAFVDYGVFSALANRSWVQRANMSNTAGALVDSVLFPTIAFGVFMPHIMLMQALAKICGGALWAWMIGGMTNRSRTLVKN